MTTTPNAMTNTGMVHKGRMAPNRWEPGTDHLYPACMKSARNLQAVTPTNNAVTCFRCLAIAKGRVREATR